MKKLRKLQKLPEIELVKNWMIANRKQKDVIFKEIVKRYDGWLKEKCYHIWCKYPNSVFGPEDIYNDLLMRFFRKFLNWVRPEKVHNKNLSLHMLFVMAKGATETMLWANLHAKKRKSNFNSYVVPDVMPYNPRMYHPNYVKEIHERDFVKSFHASLTNIEQKAVAMIKQGKTFNELDLKSFFTNHRKQKLKNKYNQLHAKFFSEKFQYA